MCIRDSYNVDPERITIISQNGNLEDGNEEGVDDYWEMFNHCLLYTSPSPRDRTRSRMPSSA